MTNDKPSLWHSFAVKNNENKISEKEQGNGNIGE